MSKDGKRSLKTRQIKLLQLFLKISDVAGTPTIGGFDSRAVSSVTDVGVGICTIIFKKSYIQALHVLGLVMITTAQGGEIFAIDVDRVTIKTWAPDGTTAQDGDFYINLVASENRFNY